MSLRADTLRLLVHLPTFGSAADRRATVANAGHIYLLAEVDWEVSALGVVTFDDKKFGTDVVAADGAVSPILPGHGPRPADRVAGVKQDIGLCRERI